MRGFEARLKAKRIFAFQKNFDRFYSTNLKKKDQINGEN